MDPMAMMMQMVSNGGGGPVGNMGTTLLGALQTYQGMKALRELKKTPRDNYTLSPELYNSQQRSFMNSKYGFTPQQTGDFNQNLGKSLMGDFRNQVSLGGGNLSQALASRGGVQRLGAINKFANQDAQLLNSNIRYNDQMNTTVQNQLNRRVGQNINYRMSDERAIGQAVQSGLTNLASSMNFAGSASMGGNTPSQNGGQQDWGGPENVKSNMKYDFEPSFSV